MKTLIFIILKLLEIISAFIAFGIFILITYGFGLLEHKWELYHFWDESYPFWITVSHGLVYWLTIMAGSGMLILIYTIITDAIPKWIKSNKKLTDEIYNKHFNK